MKGVEINEERVIVNKLGWAEYYGAHPEDDAAQSSAKQSAGDAEKARNFEVIDGKHRGFIQAQSVDLARLGTRHASASFQVGVTVISVATRPENDETVLVGWQAGCWVHAKRQKHGKRRYLYECKPEDALLLPMDARAIAIPAGRAGMGGSSYVFGFDGNQARPWVRELLAFIDIYQRQGANLLDA